MRRMILASMISVTLGHVTLEGDLAHSAPRDDLSCSQEELLAEYYKGNSFNYLSSRRCEPKPKNSKSLLTDGLPEGVGPDNFSVIWTGNFFFKDKTYIFEAKASDGIRVWLDGSLIINEWRPQEATRYRAIRSLNKGYHAIKIEYFNGSGTAIAKFHWERYKGAIRIFGTF